MRTKQQIQHEARTILAEFAANHPILMNIPLRISGRMTRAAGKVSFRAGIPYEMTLSLPFFASEDNDLRETVTHEAAHVVAGLRAGHGHAWKMVHRSMGGKAARCHSMSLASGFTARRDQPKIRVEVSCPNCGGPMLLGPTQAKKHARGAKYSHSRCPR